MELVTGVMGSLLPKLGQLLKEEYGLQKGVREKIKSLSRELEVVQAVLRKIGDVPPEQLDELVRLWARDVREACYDMEDIVDTFLVRVAVDASEPAEPRTVRRLREKVGKLFEKAKARRKISTLIQDICEKLDEVAARRGRYTVDNVVPKPVAATVIDPRLLNLYKRAADLVGIEGPRDDLIDMLSLSQGGEVDDRDVSDNAKRMKVVSVVGFGGLGKTTLAKAVYDRVRPHFECGAFVPVGRNPDMKKVHRDILIALDGENHMYSELKGLDEKQLMDKLNEFVKKKRCFIVIDDIWEMESYKLIRCALQESNFESRLIITTRIYEVAKNAGEAYKIQPLSPDNSKKLLYTRIFDGERKYSDSPSAEACDKILKKCGGVPLAIITIASLLASKPGEHWSEIYNSIGFGNKVNDDVDNTRRILSFSYYDLPSHLKACLLYLSVFQEDEVIQKNTLIWMWIAEGFVQQEQATWVGLFELGERYFNELINRSMIQPHEKKYKGYVDACSVHDMVLDMIHQLSSQQNFVTALNGEPQKLPGSISRRLALQRSDEEHNIRQLANIDLEKVRSIFASQCDFAALCPGLTLLRVLNIVRCRVEEGCHNGVLDHLGSLLHLRYLRIPYLHITELPREIRYLKFLQTLDLWACVGIKELPEEVGLLTQLVYLRAYWRTRVPAGLISKLTSLQELWIRPTGDDYAVIMQFVKELSMLRELRILFTDINVTSDGTERALLESLGNLHNIRELHIEGSSLDNGKPSDASSVSVSCRHLRFLRLDCFEFSGLPAWINSSLAPNISYIDVKVLVIKDHDMETLSRLPELCCLKLHSSDTKLLSTLMIRPNGLGYFWKLRILEIFGLSIWFDLHSSECNSSRVPCKTIMPSLESLEFDFHVRPLKDRTQIGFNKLLLGFENIGRTSLRRVRVNLKCRGARILEVEEADAALRKAAAVHPKNPTLLTWLKQTDMISPYQEACLDMRRTRHFVDKARKLVKSSRHIRALLIMQNLVPPSSKVIRLLYTNTGSGLLALTSDAVHHLWKWRRYDKNPLGKSSTSVPPQLWQPNKGLIMTNDTTDNNHKEGTASIALSKDDSYLISASGGKVTLFNMMTFKNRITFMAPPPAATFLTFHPQDNSIVVIGREDSTIQIYNVHTNELKFVLMGHQKKVTGLAFSQSMKVLVSSGADGQICVWSINGWELKKSKCIQSPSNCCGPLFGDTMVQFHYDQTHLLVVHESQLAIYDGKLERLYSWFPRDALPAPISSAVYASDGLLVYAGFRDGAIGIFEAESLMFQCKIAPSAYLPSSTSSGGIVYPMVVAASPWKPNQFAVGMSDGAVYVLEPPLDTDDLQVGTDASSSEQHPPGDVSSSGGYSKPNV